MLVGLYLLGFGFWKAHVTHMDRFVITNTWVFRIHGVFSIHLTMMPMIRIPNIPLEQPMLGKILDHGHLVFESAAQAQGPRKVRYVARPAERDLITQRVIRHSDFHKKTIMEDEDEADGVRPVGLVGEWISPGGQCRPLRGSLPGSGPGGPCRAATRRRSCTCPRPRRGGQRTDRNR